MQLFSASLLARALRTCVAAWLLALAGNSLDGAENLAARDRGLPLIRAFTPRDYEGHNQTWAMVQDRSGLLYVGNRDCVLTFDGVRWGRIPTGGLFVQGLAIDAHDRIWVGATNELGYLDHDGRGGRTYVSLRDKLPEAARSFGSCYDIVVLPHGIYFIASAGHLRWHDGAFTFEPADRVMGWAIGGEFVLHDRGQPLRAFDGQRWRIVSEDTPTRNWITLVHPRPDGSWLIGTLTDGFWTLKNGRAQPHVTEVDARLRANRISWALVLTDGTIALAQRPGGLLLLDQQGRVLHYLDVDHGLPASLVLRFLQDRDGDLWVSTDRGLSRLSWPPSITRFTRQSGLGGGVVKALARHAGRLYAGTSEGLFVHEPGDPSATPPSNARFVPVPDFAQNIWGLHPSADALLVTSDDRVRRIHADGVAEIRLGGSLFIAIDLRHRADRMLVGTTENVLLLERRDGVWQSPQILPEITGEVRSFVEAADGSVWVGVSTNGFFRVVGLDRAGPVDLASLQIEHYPGGHGLASERLAGLPTIISTENGDVRFLDVGKIFRFDAAQKRFIPVTDLAEHLTAPGITVPTLAAGHGGRLWFRSFNSAPDASPWQGRKVWALSPDGTRAALPFAAPEAIGENPVFLEEPTAHGTVLWLGGAEGLIRAELPAAFLAPRTYSAVIRHATDHTGKLLPLAGTLPRIPYEFYGLTLALGIDRLDDAQLRFETRIDSEAWSHASPLAEVSLPRLAPGHHEFSVRVRDSNDRESTPARFAFVIVPPWWLTWWAWMIYAGGAGAGIFGFVRWRLRAVRRRNEELEHLVATRTVELRAREQQLVEARDAAEGANRGQERFPRQHEPRVAHAAQRHPRLRADSPTRARPRARHAPPARDDSVER